LQSNSDIKQNILFFGFGNPGRSDDGLGAKFIEQLDKLIKDNGLRNIDTETNYQLNIEDAELVSKYGKVVFVDASKDPTVLDFRLEKPEPSDNVEFSMHSVSPDYILYLSQALFKSNAECYILSIKGEDWEFREGLSEFANKNLAKAIKFMKNWIGRNCIH
jgi:hydrogenase maturation protease